MATGALLLGAMLELVALIAAPRGWDDGQLYAHPLALSVLWAVDAVWVGLLLGAPVVLLRRHIVRPEPPCLRVGYLGIVAAPFILEWAAGPREAGWYILPTYTQVVLLFAAFVYVALARRFRLFDPGEWRASS